MFIEDISTSQILTVLAFIVVLFVIQFFILKNKNTLKGKWSTNRRILVVDSTRLGAAEKVQIIQVDNIEYLYFFSKGNQPVVVPMHTTQLTHQEKKSVVDHKSLMGTKGKHTLSKSKLLEGINQPPQTENKMIQAISAARKQNPKVSFD